MGLSFTIAAGPRQRSHSEVRVPLVSWPHFTASDSRLHLPGGPGPCIYIPQEQDDPVIPPGTGFPFRCLLRLAGLRWRYWNPPPHGMGVFTFPNNIFISTIALSVVLLVFLLKCERNPVVPQSIYAQDRWEDILCRTSQFICGITTKKLLLLSAPLSPGFRKASSL
jgi:hypothetical protein